ncbi:MAG TPA: 30S ribosomal protein S16 [Spirochaetaceae bacterium]|nr:30S ribosomal protein S16 [Spirochaetaceae bacterium]HAW84761.1 30S ribosomal protein S16 [Spirochaetaceae bacterium]HAX36464.1 30S ribosomal protein S16 [Spirochaetaceae bacterium]HBO40725.1 30S ribosomal protein S16 [Spirochaetaceae bacterium]HCQ85958.1 30S ribosomal protein S16 [Spirochaetaceae bacterium]
MYPRPGEPQAAARLPDGWLGCRLNLDLFPVAHRRDRIFQEDSVSVKIRLKKFGAKKRPYFRIVVLDSRQPRDGKTIDELGLYHPIEVADKQLRIDETKARDWMKKGAELSPTVRRLFNLKNIKLERV